MILKQVHVGDFSIGNRSKLKYCGQARGAAQYYTQIVWYLVLRRGLTTL